MTAFLTTVEQNAYLNARYTGGASISNTALYIGLSTASPGSAGSMTNEPTSTGGYARVSVGATGTTIFGSATTGVLTNSNAAITFPSSTAAWSTGATPLTYWFIADSQTIGAGTVKSYGQLTAANTVNSATLSPSFLVSQLTLDSSGW